MKTLNKISALLFLLLLNYSCAVQQQQPAYTQQQQQGVNFQVFYDDLSPYGQWVDNPNYGYVWLPDVNQDFAPYSTDGYWVNTEYGWTWVSNYNWGWAPFHYGRWDYDNSYGWFWVPGNEWGPSWVNWRSGNGYYGWAPIRPGMNVNQGYNEDYRDMNRWNFVRDRDFGRSDINRYYIDRREYNTIINNSTVINNTTVDRGRNTTYVAGPPRDNVQRATGRNINSVAIQDNDRPGQKLNNKELRIYRPQIERTNDRGQRPVPSRVTNMQEVKSARERNATNPRNNVTTPMDNNRDLQQTQPGRRLDRRNQERQQQIEKRLQQQQSTQPVQPAQQQPQGTFQQQQQNERRRQDQPQGQQQQQRDKAQPVTPPVNPQQQQQRDKAQPVTPPVQQPQVNPQQQPQRQETQTPPVQQQPQVIPQQPNVERQAPQQQRRQERQQVKQQQRNVAPAGNSRRERQQKAKEATQKE